MRFEFLSRHASTCITDSCVFYVTVHSIVSSYFAVQCLCFKCSLFSITPPSLHQPQSPLYRRQSSKQARIFQDINEIESKNNENFLVGILMMMMMGVREIEIEIES